VLAALKPSSSDSGDWRTRLTGSEEALYSAERNSMSISSVSLKYYTHLADVLVHRRAKVSTQKKAPQVPLTGVTFMPTR